MQSVSIKDMENEARIMSGSDISLSNDIGNVIELNDINDSLGLNMLANNSLKKVSIQPQEIEINNFEPVSFTVADSSPPPFFNVEVNRDREPTIYSNSQTSSASTFSLDPPQSKAVNEQDRKDKIEYLNKLQRLEQKGFPLSKRFTMDNTLEEVRDEFNRLADARNLEASLRFQRQALMGVVTGLEWANGKFDPFDLKMDGWSESVHENVEDFDEIFEELYDKYKERGKMPPEARLMFALAGSGFMCHVSNTFLRSRMPNVDDVLRSNPELARQVASAAATSAGPGFGNFMNMAMNKGQQQPPQQQSPQQQSPTGNFNTATSQPPEARREMKGPSGVDDILKIFEERKNDVFMVPESVSSVNQPATAAAMELQSVHSEEIMSQTESTRTGGNRRGRGRRVAVGNSVSIPL